MLEHVAPRIWRDDLLVWPARVWVRPLHFLVTQLPSLFMFTMTVMLFRPPDYRFHSYDRFALGLLLLAVLLHVCTQRNALRLGSAVTWPMIGLMTLAFLGCMGQPCDAETWSLFASKWLVPLLLFQLGRYIFADAQSLRRFEVFSLVVLAYLSLIAVLFLVDAKAFIFPRYIVDEAFGIHVDRARGPFLQAVANGVALNLLGLVALNSFRRRRLHGALAFLLLAALPIAILATRTRAVWLSFAGSILWVLLFSANRRLRRACGYLVLMSVLALVAVLAVEDHHRPLSERLGESGPVNFRIAVYEAGWEMFLQKPVAGWGATAMQTELSSRISDFHQEYFYFHNTYLEILVQYGLIGLALYVWVVVDLFRLGSRRARNHCLEDRAFLDGQFRSLWPVMVAVYLVNGCFVVMNYQFVNGFLFAIAGMLSAQNRRTAQGDASAR